MEKEKFSEKVSNKAEPQRLELGESPNGLPAVELRNPSARTLSAIRSIMTANMIGNPDYEARSKVGAFLQSGESKDWVLIEFWKGDEANHREFVDYLNSHL